MIFKYDINGNQIWKKQFVTGATINTTGITTISDGSIFITSYVYGSSYGNKYIEKYDSTGNLLSSISYGYGDGGLVSNKDDSIFTVSASLSAEYYLTKFTKDLYIESNAPYGGGALSIAPEDITVGSDGLIYLTGFVYGNIPGYYESNGTQDVILSKYSQTLTPELSFTGSNTAIETCKTI